MQLKAYNFSKNEDRRKAIDLLNHLIADCIVSEEYIRAWAKCDEWVRNPTEEQLKNRADEALQWREKALGYWLSMYHYLHEIMSTEEENDNGKYDNVFQLFLSLFILNRDKLHAYINKIDTGTSGISPSLRKKQYGLAHYFNQRSLTEAMRKAAKARVLREDKLRSSEHL